MHDLIARFAREFRGLPPQEREDVAGQLGGFLFAYRMDVAQEWAELMALDVESVLGIPGARTLLELLNQYRIVPGTGSKGVS